ncbi:hypothetical protein FQN57_003184 [Myotisia sp. PD_48]|nr:hypothetical protein FQN57_003184 [Myotisia sp. PD_48]
MEQTNNGSRVPDLTSVLKTLSSFNEPESRQQTPTTGPPRAIISTPRYEQPINSTDASAIITWPAALRHVMRTVAQNENTQSRIRQLISTQHRHEKDWWKGREKLLANQKSRSENKKKLDNVLRAIGGKVTNEPHMDVPQDDQSEIQIYDEKVYKGSIEMSRALHAELRAMGIPFFAINQQLVRADIDSSKDKPNEARRYISTDEVRSLQLRMLELLRDLCKE